MLYKIKNKNLNDSAISIILFKYFAVNFRWFNIFSHKKSYNKIFFKIYFSKETLINQQIIEVIYNEQIDN